MIYSRHVFATWVRPGGIDYNLEVIMFRFRFQQGLKNPNNSLSYSSGRIKVLPSTSLPDLKTLDADFTTNPETPSPLRDGCLHALPLLCRGASSSL